MNGTLTDGTQRVIKQANRATHGYGTLLSLPVREALEELIARVAFLDVELQKCRTREIEGRDA